MYSLLSIAQLDHETPPGCSWLGFCLRKRAISEYDQVLPCALAEFDGRWWPVGVYLPLSLSRCKEGLGLAMLQLYLRIRFVYALVLTRGDSIELLFLKLRSSARYRHTREDSTQSARGVVVSAEASI